MDGAVAGSPALCRFPVRSLPVHPGGPCSCFDGKNARCRHERIISLLSRPYWGEQQNEAPMSAMLSLAIKRAALPAFGMYR